MISDSPPAKTAARPRPPAAPTPTGERHLQMDGEERIERMDSNRTDGATKAPPN